MVPITTNTTTTPFTNTVYLTGAGYYSANAAGSLTIRDKSSTPIVVANIPTLAAGTTSLINQPGGVPMAGGIDIITAATTGPVNVFLNYAFD